jgi:FkbM family methyltransferase
MQQQTLELAGHALARLTRYVAPGRSFQLYHHLHSLLLGDPYWCGKTSQMTQWAKILPHEYEMNLSTADWMERYALHAGMFYSSECTAILQAFLKEGDCFIDIGANIGFLTLTASRIVGSAGKVFSFEPNVNLVSRLSRMLARNHITNVSLFPYALGNENGQIGFTREDHHGNNSVLLDINSAPAIVPLYRADDVLEGKIPEKCNALVKIDIEGSELMALRGMSSLLHRDGTAFIIEVCDEWLRRNGGSAMDIFQTMTETGYQAFLPKAPLLASKLRLRPLNGKPADRYRYDAVFFRDARA